MMICNRKKSKKDEKKRGSHKTNLLSDLESSFFLHLSSFIFLYSLDYLLHSSLFIHNLFPKYSVQNKHLKKPAQPIQPVQVYNSSYCPGSDVKPQTPRTTNQTPVVKNWPRKPPPNLETSPCFSLFQPPIPQRLSAKYILRSYLVGAMLLPFRLAEIGLGREAEFSSSRPKATLGSNTDSLFHVVSVGWSDPRSNIC